ncbi:CoA pyrophosphatase [Pseudoroseicyclus tamaricis]|uniref:CoA pyrophosphatase n=1 Tax=Pseudoroseicyclus tamaricis TaxID=2705421 RepID=A0A6B2JMA3_9RHOB|nr:CoA pyrophosphatase [Pseudoroseicyclus tamaricis]NDV02711.1 CoA pyrophosphatase [Pseudoroseicyclus tamaricis]
MSDLRGRLTRALERAAGGGSSDFDLNPKLRPEGRKLRQAGVLIGVEDAGRGPQVILTKRASHLRHHPGQIAFPGGKVEPVDSGPVDAALREAEEEIGLPAAHVEVLGTFPSHETVTAFAVTPVLALVEPGFPERPEAGEVEEIFRVPLAHLLEPANYRIEGRRWQGIARRYYAVPYGPYYIWGATARMLRGLAEVMR